jgi:methionyl-tRNA formyltransferase
MRILFAGSPEIAVPSLRALVDAPRQESSAALLEIAGALTNADSVKGRKKEAEPTAVGAFAAEMGIPALKPAKLDAEAREAVAALCPDLLVSFAYGRIFGPKFLALFPLGGVNVHPSLLPAYRGASPIQAAILNRARETGVCIQRIALEMDCGGLLAVENIPLSGRETAASLSETAARIAAAMLPPVLRRIADGSAVSTPQTGDASYCSIIRKEDGLIDWTRGAEDIDAHIRAYTPWPLSWTTHNGEKLFILEAEPAPALQDAESKTAGFVFGTDERGILVQTGCGLLIVKKLQYQAKKALDWKAFLNGARNFIGSRLSA